MKLSLSHKDEMQPGTHTQGRGAGIWQRAYKYSISKGKKDQRTRLIFFLLPQSDSDSKKRWQ